MQFMLNIFYENELFKTGPDHEENSMESALSLLHVFINFHSLFLCGRALYNWSGYTKR